MNRQNQSLSNSPQSWRELLEMLTEGPGERHRVAEALGVTPYTVTRWVTGESEPRMQNLKRLPEVFPAYQQLFSDLIQAELIPSAPPLPLPPLDRLKPEVPAEFLSRLLAAYATVSGPFRAWLIRTLILQQAIPEQSAGAWAVQREGKRAGCLLVDSTQLDYFTSARLSCIETYANPLALSFCDDEFHELHKVALHEMPMLSKQHEHTSIARF